MLELRDVDASYGDSQVLFGMTFSVSAGEVVTLLGRNGMGKTTAIRTILGIVKPHGGAITFCGKRIDSPALAQNRSGGDWLGARG